MAADSLELEITTPDRLVISETVDEVMLPGTLGYFGVLPDHAPLLTTLAEGEVSYRVGNRWTYLAVSTGFVEVLGSRVGILADTCERADEIDVDRAERAQQDANQAIKRQGAETELREANARLRRAATRIGVSSRLR
jgi:F-type H+-transporting ATPase subunit epsilon